jgi:hypothetical protein
MVAQWVRVRFGLRFRWHLGCRLRFAAWAAAGLMGVWAAAPIQAAPIETPGEVLDLEQAAALLHVDPALLSQMAQAREVPARRLGAAWRFSRSHLMDWLGGREIPATPETGKPGLSTAPAKAPSESATPKPPASVQAVPAVPAMPAVAAIGERPSATTAADVALRSQRVLLAPGAQAVDLKLAYARSSSELWSVLREDQRSLDATASLRYGLHEALQFTARLPATWLRTTTAGSAGAATAAGVATDRYIGDATLSLSGVAQHEGVARPNLIWSIDAVLPTGPGDRALGAGLVLSKSYDPAVIYASLSYLMGQRVNPGAARRSVARNSVGLSAGYTYALNDELAISTALVASWRDQQPADPGSLAPPREREEVQFGLTLQLARGLFAEPGVSVRLGGSGVGFGAALNVSYTH